MLERLIGTPFAQVVREMVPPIWLLYVGLLLTEQTLQDAGTAPPSYTRDLLLDSSHSNDTPEYRHAVKWSAGSLYGGSF